MLKELGIKLYFYDVNFYNICFLFLCWYLEVSYRNVVLFSEGCLASPCLNTKLTSLRILKQLVDCC
jgi:hypothetical protein